MQNAKKTVTLLNGIEMPLLGLGVYDAAEGDEVINAVKHAIAKGYRSIDTASVYQNEEGVGRAIRETDVPREQLFITTKVWNTDQGYESTLQAFEASRKRLKLEYVDLYLVHWPVKGKYIETWRALEKLYKDGWVKAIGVSNFHIHHLLDLQASSDTVPTVNQVEYHPMLTQESLLAHCRENHIQLEAWRPLMKGNLDVPLLQELGRKYGKTAAQIVLRWDIQHGVVTIPKSANPARIEENAAIFDFELTAEDMQRIDALNQDKRFGADPDNFDF